MLCRRCPAVNTGHSQQLSPPIGQEPDVAPVAVLVSRCTRGLSPPLLRGLQPVFSYHSTGHDPVPSQPKTGHHFELRLNVMLSYVACRVGKTGKLDLDRLSLPFAHQLPQGSISSVPFEHLVRVRAHEPETQEADIWRSALLPAGRARDV